MPSSASALNILLAMPTCERMPTPTTARTLPSIEPLAILQKDGVKARFFYTAYQGNIYGIAVPETSPVKSVADLKGKKIGVTSMASGGVIVARALIK